MSSNPDELNILINKYKKMNIEDLKATIDNRKEHIDSFNQLPHLDIAKNELELKYKERQEQIELLTKSLTSSSRFRRWISSIKAILKQFVESKT